METYEIAAAVYGGLAYENGLTDSPSTDDNLIMLLDEAAANGIDGYKLVITWRMNWEYRKNIYKNS